MFSFLRKKRKYLFIVENTSDLNFSIINRISKNHTAFIYIYIYMIVGLKIIAK